MNIPKALEILHILLYHPDTHHDLDTQNAILLGYEALSRFQTLRTDPRISPQAPLPSEDSP